MVRGRFLLHIVAFAILFLAIGTSAWGDPLPIAVSGKVWRVDGNLQGAPHVAPAAAPDGTFTAVGIDFYAAGGQTLKNFLDFGGATYANWAKTADAMSNCSGISTTGAACYSTVIEIQGNYTFKAGQIFSLLHDDGVVMYAGGTTLVIDAPGPVAATMNTWSPIADTPGAFDIFYMGTNGNPEVLQLTGTPEPTSILLLGTVCVGLGSLLRRKYRTR